MLGYALHCCYCSVHVVVISRCIVDTVVRLYRVVNSTSRVHDVWVHMRQRMQKQTSIVKAMHLWGSYMKLLVS